MTDIDLHQTQEGERWDAFFSIPNIAPRYPTDAAVRWLFRSFPRDRAGATRLLDLGCGTGRHALFFAREGYGVEGCDFSAVAIDALTTQAAAERLTVPAQVAEADSLPFPDGSFDGVLCWGVLYYMPFARFAAACAEIRRVLRPGGHALVMVKSNRDSRAEHGEPDGPHGFAIRSAPDGMSWWAEIGLTLTLMDRPGLAALFAGFSDVRIENSRVTLADGRFADDDWHIYLTA
jgi:SAM-dependent methyltransferase